MRAVIIVAPSSPSSDPGLRCPTILLPCVDRPAVQHIVEALIERGVTRFDFVLNEAPQEIEDLLGDGKRWGSTFTFHLVRDAGKPYRVLKLIDSQEPVLLVHADTLIHLSGDSPGAHPDRNTLFYLHGSGDQGDGLQWSGWAQLTPALLKSLPGDARKEELASHLWQALGPDAVEMVSDWLSFSSLDGLLEAQRRLLSPAFHNAYLSARQVEPGLWIARNVVIHPTAHLISPAFIGENARIGARARIGPNAVVGQDSVIDKKTTLQDAAVLPGSYCGEGLELDRVIVDRNHLIDVRLQTEVVITDGVILGSVRGQERPPYAFLMFWRLLAGILFLVTLPLLGACALIARLRGQTPSFSRRTVVKLPATGRPESWTEYPLYSLRQPGRSSGGRLSHLLWDVLPNLPQVIKGNLRLIGVQPRNIAEIEQLPKDWLALYLLSPAGLITEAGVVHGPGASTDEVYSSEVYYSAMAGPIYDLRLALRFLSQAVRGT